MSGTRAQVTKIDGAPGVGKTTRLQKAVVDERANGRGLADLYYVTFARSGREESIRALSEAFPDADEEEVSSAAKTFHGVTFGACARADLFDDTDRQIITQRSDEQVYREFAQTHGLRFVGESGNILKKIRNGNDLSAPGDRLFAVSSWLTLKQYPPEEYHRAPQELPFDGTTAVRLLNEWDDWKRNHYALRRFEHQDYVEEAIRENLTPGADVLFIDEFQDLSPQEYRLYKQWRDSGAVDRIYLAGDPQQSIYSFRAARPLYFEQTDVDETEQLKTSFRCPSEVAAAARDVLSATPLTDPRGFTGRRSGGEVRRAPITEPEALAEQVAVAAEQADDGVYCLARTNYHAYRVQKALKGSNIPHRWLGRRRNAWEDIAPTLQALRRVQAGAGRIGNEIGSELLGNAPRAVSRQKKSLRPQTGGGYDTAAVRDAFDGGTAAEIARQLDVTDARQQMLVSALTSDRTLTPEDVRVGTIHSAKGLEAETVFLFNGYPSTLGQEYQDNEQVRAEEHRLYYVAITRSSDQLVIVDDYCDGEAPPLEVVR